MIRRAAGMLPGIRRITRMAKAVLAALMALVSSAPLPAGDPGVEASPRIISLAPHLTELAFEAGIGGQLVGAVDWSDYPAEAASLPRIGDAFRLDLERIVRLGATDALAWAGGTPEAALSRIEGLGIEVHSIAVRSLEDIPRALLELGDLGDTPNRAQQAAARFSERHRQLAARLREREPSIPLFYQVSRSPLFTLGGRHVTPAQERRGESGQVGR